MKIIYIPRKCKSIFIFLYVVFNLGSLFGYGNSGYYPGNNRPNTGYFPNTGYYPSSSGGYYPNTGWNGGSYPTTNVGSGYYPTNTYYPSTGSGTNILGGGNGGYGGYGGNGGFRQYSGYWEPNYMGQRNRGFGYYTNTDLYGLPKANSDRYASIDRNRMPNSFRGYD